MVRNPSGANLDSGVGPGRIADQFDLQPQLEIIVILRRAEEFIVIQTLLQRAACDRAVLDAKEAQIPFPALERFSVEEPLQAALIRAGGYQRQREKNDQKRRGEFATGTREHNHLSFVRMRQARWYFSMRVRSFGVISPMRLMFMLSSRSAIFTWRATALAFARE